MKRISKMKKHLNFGRVSPFALSFVLSILFTNFSTIDTAIGQVSTVESHVSLNVKNKPLGDVLMKITQDTGYKFKLSTQWSGYPVSASIKNVPLNQVLKSILGRLNHAIIYESDKSIKIMIYGKADSRKTNPYPVESFSSQVQNYPQEPASSPELPSEKETDPESINESSRETDASGNTGGEITGDKDSVENSEKENIERTGELESKESDKDSTNQNGDLPKKNEMVKSEEDASPDSSQR